MKRQRFRDRHKAPVAPQIMKRIPGEGAKARHARRLQTALERSTETVREWCEKRGVAFKISNGGHHWSFRRLNSPAVDWWPSTAKLVRGDRWRDGIHCHDHTQLVAILKNVFGDEERKDI